MQDFHHSTETSLELLRLTMPLMQKLGIPVTPKYYALFYTYVAGENNLLKETIDHLLSNNSRITEKLCDDLFQMYITSRNEERLQQLQDDLIKVLDYLHQCLAQASKESGHFERSFTTHREKLSAGVDLKAVRKIVDALINDTHSMQTLGSELSHNLEQGGDELEKLREQLQEAKRDALTDPLTGIANRRAFDAHLAKLYKATTPCSILILDIDHFKNFNDQYGHLLGDKVLRHVANTTQECIKGRDFVARFGGEEFAVLLSDTPMGGAVRVAEEIRKTIEKTRLVRKESHEPIGPVTISIGVAQLHYPESITTFIERADKALYRSKNKGRNRVTQENEL